MSDTSNTDPVFSFPDLVRRIATAGQPSSELNLSALSKDECNQAAEFASDVAQDANNAIRAIGNALYWVSSIPEDCRPELKEFAGLAYALQLLADITTVMRWIEGSAEMANFLREHRKSISGDSRHGR